MGISSGVGYLIEFSDLQKLQQLRNELLQTETVLKSCLDISVCLKADCQLLSNSGLTPGYDCAVASITAYVGDIKIYQQSVASIMENLQCTADVVCEGCLTEIQVSW